MRIRSRGLEILSRIRATDARTVRRVTTGFVTPTIARTILTDAISTRRIRLPGLEKKSRILGILKVGRRSRLINVEIDEVKPAIAPKKCAQSAFSVNGCFRQLLSDLIKYMHNSNRRLHQVTLLSEALLECKFYVIGFVPANVVRLKRDWFSKLNSEQVSSVEKFLAGSVHGAHF